MKNQTSKISKPSAGEEKLVHMLYEAVVDNSLWPDLVGVVLERLDSDPESSALQSGSRKIFSGVSEHFERALRLSEGIADLRDKNTTLTSILDTIPMGAIVYSLDGGIIYANHEAKKQALDKRQNATLLKPLLNPGEQPTQFHKIVTRNMCADLVEPVFYESCDDSGEFAFFPSGMLRKLGLPQNVAAMVISTPSAIDQVFLHFQQTYFLNDIETHLLAALYEFKDLNKAAVYCSLELSTAETHRDRIYIKVNVDDLKSLIKMVDGSPTNVLQNFNVQQREQPDVRRLLKLPDGLTMEYFSLGPEDGYPIVHFDGLSGLALDLIGTPQRYSKALEENNLRIITPCRPGTFRSDYKIYRGLSQSAVDVVFLMDQLEIENAALLSQTLGSGSALAVASLIPDYIDQVVMCATNFPDFELGRQRGMDSYYTITNVIGKRAPWLLRSILPFFLRSVVQDPVKFFKSHNTMVACDADRMIFDSPNAQKRVAEILQDRTANGYDGVVQENYLSVHGWDFDLSAITSPVTMFHGVLDNVNPAGGAQKLAAQLPNATLNLYADFGQYMLFTEWPWILEMCAGATPINLPRQTDTIVPVEMLSSSGQPTPITTQH